MQDRLGLLRFLLLGLFAGTLSCDRPLSPTAPAESIRVVAAAATSNGRPHAYVHYDYLVFSGPNSHSDAPDPAAIQLIVDAYAAHGIDLVVDSKHTAIPGQSLMILDADGGARLCSDQVPDAFTLQQRYFHPTSNHDWHYAVFGDHTRSVPSCQFDSQDDRSGIAELNGNTFLIAVSNFARLPPSARSRAIAGTFMHELGHNLGLHHGGNEDHNYKPNYLSVMNYKFQFGIPYAATVGSTTVAGFRFDYSGQSLPTLDEAHLNEALGIQAGSTDISSVDNNNLGFFLIPASGPVDWNNDGRYDNDIVSDTDFLWELTNCGCGPNPSVSLDRLTGFDDWTEVRGYLDGTLVHGPKTIIHENRADEPIVSSIAPKGGPATGGTVVTITGDHFNKATRVVFGSAGPASFTIIDDRTITAVAPRAAPEYVTDVTVASNQTASPFVEEDRFTYASVPPIITSLSPSFGPQGTVMTIHGSHLSETHDVHLSGDYQFALPNFTEVDDHTLTATIPRNLILGLYHVVVTTSFGTNAGHLVPADVFNLVSSLAPSITEVVPGTGAGSGGTAVTISGALFTWATAVRFGNTDAPSFTVVDDNTITAVSPPGTGTVDVSVTGLNGTSLPRVDARYVYLPAPPTVSSVSPAEGPSSGGTAITIHGSGFAHATAVSIGPYGIASFTIVDDATIMAVTASAGGPACGCGPGTYRVTVANAGGTSALSPGGGDLYTYH